MEAFSHFTVLVSIVVGLGITNVLSGLVGIIHHRARVRLYWPVVLWLVILFLVFVQSWWALFNLHNVTKWTFFTFLLTVLFPVLLFTLSSLILPDFSGAEVVDLRADYFRERKWFFGLLVVTLCISMASAFLGPLMLAPNFLGPAYLVTDAVYLAGAVLGLFVEN